LFSHASRSLTHNILVRTWPAVDLEPTADPDLLLATIDGLDITAIEEHPDRLRVFFSTDAARDSAVVTLRARRCNAVPVDIDDEDWARRSQEGLAPIRVGRVVVAPPWAVAPATSHESRGTRQEPPVTIVISPSMGFGTGHHATTRLCLAALQTLELSNRSVLDVGTGSGVLAIAAARLGASSALGIDVDADAVQAARESLALNLEACGVSFEVADVRSASLSPADIVMANLTGALVVRVAADLLRLVRSGGVLVVSGVLSEERGQVLGALESLQVEHERHEDGWLGITLKKR
jgi:ribosomal protein L11 methyltransferase